MHCELTSACFLTPGIYLLQSWPNWLLLFYFIIFLRKDMQIIDSGKKKIHYVTPAVFFP